MSAEGLKRSIKEEKESRYWILPLLLLVAGLPVLTDEYYLSVICLCGVYAIAAIGLDILTPVSVVRYPWGTARLWRWGPTPMPFW